MAASLSEMLKTSSTHTVSGDICTGLVSFNRLTLLGCPEYVLNSRAVDLATQIYIGSQITDSLLSLFGSLRYFNSDHIVFNGCSLELFFIQAMVSIATLLLE